MSLRELHSCKFLFKDRCTRFAKMLIRKYEPGMNRFAKSNDRLSPSPAFLRIRQYSKRYEIIEAKGSRGKIEINSIIPRRKNTFEVNAKIPFATRVAMCHPTKAIEP